MDDLDYLFPDAGDAAYRGYDDAYPRDRTPEQAGTVQAGTVPPGTVWQRVADGPWSPLGAPVPGRLPAAPQPRSQPARREPYSWSPGYPADGYRPGHGAAYGAPPAPRRQTGRPSDRPRRRRPRRSAPDGARRPPARTSLLSTAPIVIPAEPPRLPAPRPAPYGKVLPDWLPFGRRLVLLPKAGAGNLPVARLTGRPAIPGELRLLAVALLTVGLAFFLGYLVGGHVG